VAVTEGEGSTLRGESTGVVSGSGLSGAAGGLGEQGELLLRVREAFFPRRRPHGGPIEL